jgi:Cu/Ag efflux pump CusA
MMRRILACSMQLRLVILAAAPVLMFVGFTRLTLIWPYRHLEKQEGGDFSAELVLRGTRDRLVSILMTAIVTALAFAPFLLFGGIAGLEILRAMAIAILGGLVTSTLVSLLVVPALYLGFGASAEPDVLVEEEPPRLVA